MVQKKSLGRMYLNQSRICNIIKEKTKIMAKKKTGADLPLMEAFGKILDGLSPEQQMKVWDTLEYLASSGKGIQGIREEVYTYQCPDYSKMVKPLMGELKPLLEVAKPGEALAAYAKAREALVKLSQQEREEAVRNLLVQILADGQSRNFEEGVDVGCMPLLAIFQLVDDFQLVGLFDVILETFKQGPAFFTFYYSGFGDAAILMLAHVGKDHLEELKEIMKTGGFVLEVYPTILNAVIQMAVEDPFFRLPVLAWVADILRTCIGKTLSAMTMDWVVMSLAQIKAADLLPIIKDIYKKYNVPAVEIRGGIKGVTKLLTQGTDRPVVEFKDFKDLLNELVEDENSVFELNDDRVYLDNCLFGDDWDDDVEYKPKAKPAKGKGGKQKYALTLDVTLKGSPRKVYRQLVVPSDMTLENLGEILIDAVGWEGYHLNQFIDGNAFYLVPQEDDWAMGNELDASAYTIGNLLGRVNSKIKWEYDFGDSWIHEITLVSKQAVGEKEKVKVQLLKGTGACPPEDCGGVGGYRHLLNVLKDPNDEEYEEMVNWLGGNFDPKRFSLGEARAMVKACAERLED